MLMLSDYCLLTLSMCVQQSALGVVTEACALMLVNVPVHVIVMEATAVQVSIGQANVYKTPKDCCIDLKQIHLCTTS